MIRILLIGTGSFIGSVCRYLLSGAVQQRSVSATFPYGTFAVNISGGFIIGFLPALNEDQGLFGGSSRTIDPVISEGLATLDKVNVQLYSSGR
jgi:CrcB protein